MPTDPLDNEAFPSFKIPLEEFYKIPGCPFAYWLDEKIRDVFAQNIKIGNIADAKVGLATGKNETFVRYWHEVSIKKIGFFLESRDEAKNSKRKWFPYNKGGQFRKWYGNNEYIVNWENDGEEIYNFRPRSVIRNPQYYFKPSITWSFVSISFFGVRYSDPGAIFDVGGSSVFPDPQDIYWLTGFLCSKLSTEFMKILNPTVNFQAGNVASLPIIPPTDQRPTIMSKELIRITKDDWNSYETSWGFTSSPLLSESDRLQHLQYIYKSLRDKLNYSVINAQRLEEENNRYFIELYGLQNEISSIALIEDVTLTCNPYYRYPESKKTVYEKEELESRLLVDTMKEFISYAVGCMFGRYSLDKPGLILANQGETTAHYRRQIPNPNFPPDEDNVIPILEAGWFTDDITERFKKFLRVTFGEEHYEENLAFIENALDKDIRSYFLKDFYNEHVKMYKKRPIYWLFSSPNGSFNALIYMHRYHPDTVSVVLNDYLREYVRKLNAHKAHLEQVSLRMGGSQAEKTRATKEINALNKVLAELKEYEDDVLYPLATRQIKIDLDDGVKVNYNKFGKALRRINGLSE